LAAVLLRKLLTREDLLDSSRIDSPVTPMTLVTADGPAAGSMVQENGSPLHRRILIVAGEASGDLHGANLAREIRALAPGTELFGIAGRNMRAAGVRALVNTEDIAGLGVMELASTIGRTLRALGTLRALIRHQPPDLAILIDYAEFNMMLAGIAKRAGIPVLYYIVPQVWAWRRGRIGKLVRRVDRLAVVFPFEAEVYAAAGERAVFVGHPLLDLARPAQTRSETLKRHGFQSAARLLALLPGSRRGEVHYLLRPMVEAARVLAARYGLTPWIARAPTLTDDDLRAQAGSDLSGLRIFDDDTYSIIAASELALVTSGTATLETALLECPMVIAYKMAPLTYAMARLLVRGVDFIGMPNILGQSRIVPELIQAEVTSEGFVKAAAPLLTEPGRSRTIGALHSIRERLGEPGAAMRVANLALAMTL
jgi:lipid-A-disaccharide synthase